MKKWPGWLRGSARAADVTLPIDLSAPAFFAEPAPIYAWLRENHPVAPVKSGGFVLTRYGDIFAALSNPGLSNAPSRFSSLNARNKAKYAAADLASHIPPFLDKPEHVPIRKALSSAFYDVFEEAQNWVPELADQVVAKHKGQTVDLIKDIASPFACQVMARFLGVSASVNEMKIASDAFFRLFAPVSDAEVFRETNAALEQARALIVKTQGQGGLLGALGNFDLSTQAIIDNAYLVLADGVENIEASIAMAFRLAAENKCDLNDENVLAIFVPEALRLNSPAQLIPRVARESIQLHGVDVTAGMPVFLALGSANLDPEQYGNPNTLDLTRSSDPLLAFGKGRHSCIGAPLAKLQISAMLSALSKNGASVKNPRTPLEYQHRFGHRWPNALGVQIP